MPLVQNIENIKTKTPNIAILVPSYKEPLSVIENTLVGCYNLNYKNRQIFLLDDTRYDLEKGKLYTYRKDLDTLCERLNINIFRREWRGAKAGIINDFVDYVQKKQKKGSFLKFFLDKKLNDPKYIVVFDADQNPFPDFLDNIVKKMELNDKLAFVQTPQYYTNFMDNDVARATGYQQIVFFEYICEGKHAKEAMFACGTNIIIRLKAFIDVGGFDETSVTEDCSTSLDFHMKGWKTSFDNKVGAFGMGPEDLGAYFKQQFRWALGTLSLFRKVVSGE